MTRQLDAVYEQGILRPLEPLTLPEHQRVRLTLDDQPTEVAETMPTSDNEKSAQERPAKRSWMSTEPVNHRYEEMQWLAKESAQYAGEWVAVEGPRLMAHGLRLADVSAAAKAAGAKDPLFSSIPDHPDLPFGGWQFS